MKFSLRNLSLRKKLIGLILFITFSSLILALGILHNYNKAILKKRMARELMTFAEIIGKNNTATVLFNDKSTAKELLDALSANKNINAAYILKSNGDIFVKYIKEGYSKPIGIPDKLVDDYIFTSNNLEIVKEIFEGNEKVCTIYINSNLNELSNQNKVFLNLSLIVLFIALVYAFVSTFILEKPLSRPILKLAKVTKDISEFKDFTMRIEKYPGSNEFTILYDGFNNMLGQIEEQSNRLIKAFVEISGQKKEIEHQRDKIDKQSQELQKTYSDLKQYINEIQESIRYAKTIQDSILPPIDYIKKLLPESFVFYRPRDVVSGDFYWCTNIYDKIFITAADCTGHGIPGTLLSILGSTLLNQIVVEQGILKPSEILDYLDKGMRQVFYSDKKDQDLMDGMDMALLMIDLEDELLEYAGAVNPLLRIRNNEVEVFKADKISIVSMFREEIKEFTNQVIPFQKGDTFYVFSDGFQDQIGGPLTKKLKSKGLMNLLLEIQDKSMVEQEKHVSKFFDDWKKDFFQIDDVILVGLRV